MTKIEHLQFLALMIPTFLILLAVAVSMADLASPATPDAQALAAVAQPTTLPGDAVWDDRPAK